MNYGRYNTKLLMFESKINLNKTFLAIERLKNRASESIKDLNPALSYNPARLLVNLVPNFCKFTMLQLNHRSQPMSSAAT